MKSPTDTRGAWRTCAFSSACTLAMTVLGLGLPAVALAAPGTGNSNSSAAAKSAAAHSKGVSVPAIKRISAFEHHKLDLSGAAHSTAAGASGSIVRTIVGLAIVIAVIYGLYWIMKQSRAPKNAASGDGLEQLATLPLGANRSVALVRVGGELHLLGLSEHAISPLRIFTEEEAYELGLPLEAEGPVGNGDGEPPIQRLVEAMRRFTAR